MSATDQIDVRTLGVGGAVGIAAYVVGYLLTYVTQRDTVEEQLETTNWLLQLLGGEPIPPTRAVGWLFYNAHFVDTVVPDFGGQRTVNFVAQSDGGSVALLYLVPPVLLLAAGVAIAYAAGGSGPAAGAVAGALAVVGYLPMAIAGRIAFTYPIRDAAIVPDVVTAVLLAGICYPLVFGAIGGVLAGFVRGRA